MVKCWSDCPGYDTEMKGSIWKCLSIGLNFWFFFITLAEAEIGVEVGLGWITFEKCEWISQDGWSRRRRWWNWRRRAIRKCEELGEAECDIYVKGYLRIKIVIVQLLVELVYWLKNKRIDVNLKIQVEQVWIPFCSTMTTVFATLVYQKYMHGGDDPEEEEKEEGPTKGECRHSLATVWKRSTKECIDNPCHAQGKRPDGRWVERYDESTEECFTAPDLPSEEELEEMKQEQDELNDAIRSEIAQKWGSTIMQYVYGTGADAKQCTKEDCAAKLAAGLAAGYSWWTFDSICTENPDYCRHPDRMYTDHCIEVRAEGLDLAGATVDANGVYTNPSEGRNACEADEDKVWKTSTAECLRNDCKLMADLGFNYVWDPVGESCTTGNW